MWASLAVLLLAACSPRETTFGFTIEGVQARITAGVLNVTVDQKIILSPEARKALDHGVPLFIQTEFALREAGSRRDLELQAKIFEIRYLPLSKRYQLTTSQPLSKRTFPRLRHVLAEIQTVSFVLPTTGWSPGAFDLCARSYLEKNHMPPPMRLPMWFSSNWQHDSGWRSWPFNMRAGA